jgi:tol-pal system protein YbgF
VRRFIAVPALALAACALKGDVRKVELRVQALQAETARADSARAAQLDSIFKLITAAQAAIDAQRQYLTQVRGESRAELLNVERLLVQLQELAGVSQQRISELRAQLDQRAQSPLVPPDPAAQPQPSGPGSALPGPDYMFDLSLQQLRRGSLGTARAGFREFMKQFPTHERGADALFYIGESFAVENPDSAAAVYEQVVTQYANSTRAPSALYKLGLLSEQRGNRQAARNYFNRVISRYPRSDEAALARDRLQQLGR